MLPLGILGSARVAPTGGGPAYLSSGGGPSRTVTGLDLGTSGDLLLVAFYLRTDAASGGSITSVTVGGVTADINSNILPVNANGNAFAFCQVTSPGGIGDVACTSGGAAYRCGVGVWVVSAAPTFSASANGNTSATLTCPAGGFVLAVDYTHETTAPTLTGITTDFDTLAGTYHFAGGHSTSAGSVTVSTSATSTVGRVAAVAYA